MYYCINMCVGNRTDWHRHSPDSKNTVQIYKGDRVVYIKPVRSAIKLWLVTGREAIPLTVPKNVFKSNFRKISD